VICTVVKLVLVCFFGLAFVASVGCVLKSAKKCWKVRESESVKKRKFWKKHFKSDDRKNLPLTYHRKNQ
jgi:hypothetical protein